MGDDGRARVTSTICPVKLVTPEYDAFLDWFFHAAELDGSAGTITVKGIEWPRPGGLMKQSARLVAAVDIVRNELRYLAKPERVDKRPDPAAGAEQTRPKRGRG